ncbi:hypothetical protein [Acinetobacter sp. WCHA39]|uniref:hypothetical protein n=1 Tax=Acinetobacter sp. WCHA39 TaxID=2004648 RepID=UPI000B3BFE55|nr:hypothetical protein [Acinetobacter sp. WCHA39]
MRSEFEKHFLSLKFATEGSAQRCLDSCTFDSEQDAYLPDVNWISDNDEDECVIYCCMLNTSYISFKEQQSKIDELQKRVDAAQKLIDDWSFGGVHIFDLLDELEQALKGGFDE